jgi:hypothetical protein
VIAYPISAFVASRWPTLAMIVVSSLACRVDGMALAMGEAGEAEEAEIVDQLFAELFNTVDSQTFEG